MLGLARGRLLRATQADGVWELAPLDTPRTRTSTNQCCAHLRKGGDPEGDTKEFREVLRHLYTAGGKARAGLQRAAGALQQVGFLGWSAQRALGPARVCEVVAREGLEGHLSNDRVREEHRLEEERQALLPELWLRRGAWLGLRP